MILFFVLIFLSNFKNVKNARILAVLPFPSKSHQYVFQPIIKSLVKNGHNVVFVTMMQVYPKKNTPDNYKEINLQEISFTGWQDELEKVAKGSSGDIQTQLKMGLKLNSNLLEKQFNSQEFKSILNDDEIQFDLLITHSFSWIALMLSHRYHIPLIQISSMGYLFQNCESAGVPVHPLLYPELLQQKHYNRTILEKFSAICTDLTIRHISTEQEVEDNAIIKKFYDDAPDLTLLRHNIHMLFMNMHTIWDENRPVPLSVASIYGVHLKKDEKLPKELQLYLDKSINGIVYLSFGTNVKPSLLPSEKIEMMLTVLSQLPYYILLKWDEDEIPGRPKNVRIGKWFPQADLLKHPNIKVFITQAGLQSTDEAIAAGVPLIGIPILFDQFMNAENYIRHGIGVKLNIETLTSEEFRLAVTSVIENESYRKNIIKLRDIFHDQPMQPLNRTIWWMEYVLRHNGAQHLRAPAANMSWAEFFEAELLFLTIIILILILVATYIIMRIIFNYLLYKCMQIVMKIKQK